MKNETEKFGALFIVATPIGNLSDITLRAIEILKFVDIVACEDTRVSKKLLDHLGIEKKMMSLHQHSGEEKYDIVSRALERGLNIAYITDGGTPGISDPGSELVHRVREMTNNKCQITNKLQIPNSKNQKNCHSESRDQGDPSGLVSVSQRSRNEFGMTDSAIKIVPIPGPSAVAAAISVSGMVEKEFYFAGFLPKKKGRQTKFKMLKNVLDLPAGRQGCPIVIYESAMRIEKTLEDIEAIFGGETEIFIAREMTKMFEEYWGGNIEDIISDLHNHKLKGEIVLIVKKAGKLH